MIPSLIGVDSAQALRRVVCASPSRASTLWLSALGIGIGDADGHRAFQAGLRSTGLHGDLGRVPPQLTIIDWSLVAELCADSLAYATVVLHALVDRGVPVICCPPDDEHGRQLLMGGWTAPLRREGVVWLSVAGEHRKRAAGPVLLSPIVTFGGSHGPFQASTVLAQLEESLDRHGWPPSPLVSEMVMELVQNTKAHANASVAAMSAMLFPRRRPAMLQVAVADDGVGIPASLQTHPRYAWLGLVSDASAVESVYAARWSRRAPAAGGGVLGELLQLLLAEYESRIVVRSGSGHVCVTSRRPTRASCHSFSHGFGTQHLLEIRRPLA